MYMGSTKLATCSLTRIVILVLYITTLQPTSSLATLKADGVEKYVITRRGRYNTDVFRVQYKTGFQCPSDVCANTSAFVNNTKPCSCSCKGNTPTFLPELGSCGDTASIKKSLFGNCSQALGLESGKVSDSQLSALSHLPMFSPLEGRLNNEKAWCTSLNDLFLQIDLLEVRHVSALATQGYKGSFSNYVKTYEIEYSYDGLEWFGYKDDNGKNKTFTGNKDTDSVKYNNFKGSFETRFLRIYPKKYNRRGFKCLRVEVYGCNDNAVCSRFFEWDFFLKSLNLANEGQVNIVSANTYQSCQVVPGSAAYYNYQLENKWLGINSEMFKVEKTQSNLVLKWADTTKKDFLGRIVQVKVTCSYSAPASKPNKTACLVFKTSGKITLDLSTMPKTTPYISPVTTVTVFTEPTKTTPYISPVTTVTVFTEPTKSSKMSLVTEPVGGTGDKDARTSRSNSGSGVLIGVAVACAVVFAIILIVLVVFCKRRKLKKSQQGTSSTVQENVYGNSQFEIPLRTKTGKDVKPFSDQENQPTYQDIVQDSEPMYGGTIYSAPEVNRYDNRVYQSLDENVSQTSGYQALKKGHHGTGQPTEQSSAMTEPVYNSLEKPDIAQENVDGSLYNVLERPPAGRSCKVLQEENPLYNVFEGPDPRQDQQEPLYNVLGNGLDTNGRPLEDGANDEYLYNVLERPGPKQNQQEPLYNVLDNGPDTDRGPFENGANNESLYNVLEGPDLDAGPNSSEAEYAAPREPCSLGSRNNPSYEQTLELNVPYEQSKVNNGSVYEALRGANGDDMYQPLTVT